MQLVFEDAFLFFLIDLGSYAIILKTEPSQKAQQGTPEKQEQPG